MLAPVSTPRRAAASPNSVISRFMPIIRTFIPFVAGIGAMDHLRFQLFNVTGAALWVVLLIAAGHFFGNMPLVRYNLTLVILLIVVISLLPAIIGYWRQCKST